MAVRFIYGKPGSGKSQKCYLEIAEILKKEKDCKIFMITPEQFSFTAEKTLMEFIPSKAVINAEVVTISRLAHRILSEIGGNNKKVLSKCGKAMLIYSILEKENKNLKFLNKSDENIDLCMNLIKEFKKHGININDLSLQLEKLEDKDKYLQSKLSDVLTLYSSFEEKIKDKYIEETDYLDILLNNIKSLDYLKDAYIFIDEFAGFTYQEYQVIGELARVAKQLNITMTTNNFDFTVSPHKDIFHSNKITISKLIELFENLDIEIEERVFLEKNYRFKNKEVEHLSENISNIKSSKYDGQVNNVSLFLAKNAYSEIENIAKIIKKMEREKGYRYKDIGIITKNIPNYASLVRSIFSEYQIPVFIDDKRDLNQNIIVQYILSIFEIINSNLSMESVINYLKFGFLDIDMEDIFSLENYAANWGIKFNKWKNEFKYETGKEKYDIKKLNEIRVKVIKPIIQLKNDIDKNRTVENISKLIYEFLQKQNIEYKLAKKIEELELNKLFEIKEEYKESYNIIIQILSEIVNIFGEEKITLDKYIKVFKTGLKNSSLAKIPGTQDQVILGDVERSRSHKTKVAFIIGINDGVFPSVRKDEGFLNDNDRKYLKDEGMGIANGTMENLYEENFNIYKTFSIAEEMVNLSYVSTDPEGKSLRPSIMINKLKNIFPKLKEESDIISKDYKIINEKSTYDALLENIYKEKNNETMDEIWFQVYHYFNTNDEWKDKLQNDISALSYTNIAENIKPDNIQKLYGNKMKTSVSKLESYRRCPFSYHMQYGLNLKEKEELKVQSFDTGSFMHDIIEQFFDYTSEKGLGIGNMEEEEIAKIVNQIINENLKDIQNYKFTATAKYKVLVKRLERLVIKSLKYIIKTITESNFKIHGTEIKFGDDGEYKSIKMNLDNGKEIEITGKIDRVDIAETDDGKYVRIIDYKSSAKDIKLNEVYAGLQLQLLTYIDAICKEEDIIPAGVFYFSLLEQMITADKKISKEEIEDKIRNNFKMRGLIVADIKIIELNDNNLISNTGKSKMIPAGITKDGAISKRDTNGVSKEEFKILQEHIYTTIKQITNEIYEGNIDIYPFKRDKQTACGFCLYKSICGFDANQKNNRYNYLEDTFEFAKK